jgi:hypothetical protein
LPEIEDLKELFNTFKGGNLFFSIDKKHTTSENLVEPEKIIKLIKYIQKDFNNFIPVINYSGLYLKNNLIYRKLIEEVLKEVKCRIIDVSVWWRDIPKPGENGLADESEFDKFYNLSRQSYLMTYGNRWE